MSRGSGRSTAITTGVTPGWNSAIRATEVALIAPGPWQGATVEEVRKETERGRPFASASLRLRVTSPASITWSA